MNLTRKTIFLFLILSFHLVSISQEIKPMKLDELAQFIQSRTRPTVFNFWATWCGPCVQEMPWFNKIVNDNKDVDMVFVSVDDNRAYPGKIQSFINAKNIEGTLIWLDEPSPDISSLVPRWSGMIPTTIFVNNKSGYKKFKEQQVSPGELRKQLRLLTRE
jgi:thiol-disulfide isomerase/thioredoxin